MSEIDIHIGHIKKLITKKERNQWDLGINFQNVLTNKTNGDGANKLLIASLKTYWDLNPCNRF